MTKRLILLTLVLLTRQFLFSQEILPIIRANSQIVDIRDGENFYKGTWTISPQIKPDVFITNFKNSKVTFYTDIDSISFLVKPNEKYQFVILLNDKDSALTEIAYETSYLDILKKASEYNLNDNRKIPEFKYQSMDDPNLVSLRKNYNLDSIAGTGNDISQILNLVHWIHNLIPHDGQYEKSKILNAEYLLTVFKTENRGLNCRSLAMALNECYLSLGFKSRYVICLPKDSLGVDYDNHVINMVFSNYLNKWVWIDPTNDAYIMNENGELLGIEEVRERIIEEKPVILNPDANWNRKESIIKENYLYNYMAKNLYILECPVFSQYDSETQREGKVIQFIRLLPLDYFRQTPDKFEISYNNSDLTFEKYNTNNSEQFWKKPEKARKHNREDTF